MTDFAPEKPGAAPIAAASAAPSTVPVKRIVGALVALGVAGGALAYYLHARHYEDTDDAQIDGEITNISPRVAGTIVSVAVSDNQVVKAGDVIAELDPTDYEVAVAQARAVLAQAEAVFQAENPSVSMTETINQTSLSSAEADVASAQSRGSSPPTARSSSSPPSSSWPGQRQERRRPSGSAPTSSARAAPSRRPRSTGSAPRPRRRTPTWPRSPPRWPGRRPATPRRSRASPRRDRTSPSCGPTRPSSSTCARPAWARARRPSPWPSAQLRQAELNLGLHQDRRPGRRHRRAQVDEPRRPRPARAAARRHLPRRRPLGDRQLPRDADPRHARRPAGERSRSTPSSLDAARHRGEHRRRHRLASFSLFPPENASGNYVKVVQRIPVRIRLDPGQPGIDRLRPGMSVEPEVTVR